MSSEKRADSPRDGDSPRPASPNAEGGDSPIARPNVVRTNSIGLKLPARVEAALRDVPRHVSSDGRGADSGAEPEERRREPSADSDPDAETKKDNSSTSSGDASTESDEKESGDDDDDEKDSSDDDSDEDSDDDDEDSDEDSDEEDDDDEEEDEEEAARSALTHKKLGRIRPQFNKPTLPPLSHKPILPALGGGATGNANGAAAAPALGGLKLALPKPALSLPIGQLPSLNNLQSGSPPVTPLPYEYKNVRDLHLDLEKLVADRFEREQFQERFEKKDPETLKFLSRPDTLGLLVKFVTRTYEPHRVDNEPLTSAQKTVVVDSCSNFAVYLLTTMTCTRLQGSLLSQPDLLDELMLLLRKSSRPVAPTQEWGKLVASLAIQKNGDDLKAFFTSSNQRDSKNNIVSLLVDNLDNAHVVKMITEIVSVEKPRTLWNDFFAEKSFDFASALFKRFASISEVEPSSFEYILRVELQHISDLASVILDKAANTSLGKQFSTSAAYAETIAKSIHRARLHYNSVSSATSLTEPAPVHPALAPALTILSQILRYHVNGGRYNEIVSPVLDILCSDAQGTVFDDVVDLLKDTNGANGRPVRFGLFRNQLIDVVERLYSTGYQRVHEKMFAAKQFEVLFDIFLSRSTNTVLHQKAATIIKDILQCNSKELLVQFLVDYKFVDKIVDAFDKYEAAMKNVLEFNALDFYPHLFQIALRLDLVAKMAPRYQLLADYLNGHEGWKRFVSSELYRNYDEALKKKLMKEQGAIYIRKKVNQRR